MTNTFLSYASPDRSHLSLRAQPGYTEAYLSFDGYTSDPDLCVALPAGLQAQTFYVEAVCLDYEFVDGGFDLTLYDTEAGCLAAISDDDLALDVGFGATEVSVAF